VIARERIVNKFDLLGFNVLSLFRLDLIAKNYVCILVRSLMFCLDLREWFVRM